MGSQGCRRHEEAEVIGEGARVGGGDGRGAPHEVAGSRMLTVPQAVARLRENGVAMSKDVIYDMVRGGAFPHVRAGRRVLVPVAALERWMDGAWRPHDAGLTATEAGASAAKGEPRPRRRRLRITHAQRW
jgi:excisionase family DNA binding protein